MSGAPRERPKYGLWMAITSSLQIIVHSNSPKVDKSSRLESGSFAHYRRTLHLLLHRADNQAVGRVPASFVSRSRPRSVTLVPFHISFFITSQTSSLDYFHLIIVHLPATHSRCPTRALSQWRRSACSPCAQKLPMLLSHLAAHICLFFRLFTTTHYRLRPVLI